MKNKREEIPKQLEYEKGRLAGERNIKKRLLEAIKGEIDRLPAFPKEHQELIIGTLREIEYRVCDTPFELSTTRYPDRSPDAFVRKEEMLFPKGAGKAFIEALRKYWREK